MRQILHIDMDAFFAAVEQRDHPELRGRPLLVGGAHRGVVCAASYEARPYGIASAMPMQAALRRCPHAVVVAPRHGRYREVSAEVFAIFARFTPHIEGLSLDEAFLDVTASVQLFGAGATIAGAIKRAIREELGLRASAGVAPCKFVAKIASDLRKPDALVVVGDNEVETFLAPLPVERMWGIGAVAAARLRRVGIATLGAVAAAPEAELVALLGRGGARMRELARGIDARPVISDSQAQSMGAEDTFAADRVGTAALLQPLLAQTLRVALRLGGAGLACRTVVVKLKTCDFKVATRRLALPQPSSDPDTLFAAVRSLLPRFGGDGVAYRLCGVSAHELCPDRPAPSLFADPQQERRRRIETVRRAVSERFGSGLLTRASLLAAHGHDG